MFENNKIEEQIKESVLKNVNFTNVSNLNKTKDQNKNNNFNFLRSVTLRFNQFQKCLPKLDDEMTLEKLITALHKDRSNRTEKDLMIIDKFLNDTELLKMFRNDNVVESSMQKIKYFCSLYLKYQFLPKNSILFRAGDVGDKFFIILQGKVKIIKPYSETKKLSLKEYISYLKELSSKGDTHLIKMTINENFHCFPVELKDVVDLNEIIFKIKYRKLLLMQSNIEEIEKLFNESGIDPKLYGVEVEQIGEKNKSNQIKHIYGFSDYSEFFKAQLLIVNGTNNDMSKKLDRYLQYERDFDKKTLSIYRDNHFMDLNTGQYFGHYALETFKGRSATILADDDTHLAWIDEHVYREHIHYEKQIVYQKEINFLIENFTFNSVEKISFEKKYFHFFIQEEYYRGNILVKENEKNEYVYIIKEGEVEVSATKNIPQIVEFIKTIRDKSILGNEFLPFLNLKIDLKICSDSIFKKKLFKLFLFGSREIVGLEEFFFDFKSMYQVKIISEKVKIFKIDTKELKKMLYSESYFNSVMLEMAKMKTKKIVNRLEQFKMTHLNILNKNYSDRLVSEDDKLKFRNKSSQNESSVTSLRVCKTEINKNALLRLKNEKMNFNRKVVVNNNNNIISDYLMINLIPLNSNYTRQSQKMGTNITRDSNLCRLLKIEPKEINVKNSPEDKKDNFNRESNIIAKITKDINLFNKNSIQNFKNLTEENEIIESDRNFNKLQSYISTDYPYENEYILNNLKANKKLTLSNNNLTTESSNKSFAFLNLSGKKDEKSLEFFHSNHIFKNVKKIKNINTEKFKNMFSSYQKSINKSKENFKEKLIDTINPDNEDGEDNKHNEFQNLGENYSNNDNIKKSKIKIKLNFYPSETFSKFKPYSTKTPVFTFNKSFKK